MNSDVIVAAADVMRGGIAPHDTGEWVAAVVAFIALCGAVYQARSSSRTEKRGQNIERDANIGQQWQFLTGGMRAEIDALRRELKEQHDHADRQDASIKDLQGADRNKRDQIAALMAHIGRLEQALSEWREYGLRLGKMLVSLGHTPPEPPIDYEDHE